MAPLFLVRKSEKKEVHEDELSAGEEGLVDGLSVPAPAKKRRRKSLFDRMPSSLNTATDVHPAVAEAKLRSGDASPSATGSLLNAFNNLMRSPRSAVADSNDNLLQPPAGRPRAKTAPSSPGPSAINLEPIELPAEVYTDESASHASKEEVELTDDDSIHLPRSVWLRTPRLSCEESERAVSPLSEMSIKELSPRSRRPVSPQKETPVLRSVSQRIRSVEDTLSGGHEPVSRENSPPPDRQALPLRHIPMPSWPVSRSSNGLLGPIPPGAAARPAANYPLIPKTPFFLAGRTHSLPTQQQQSPSHHSPLRTPGPSPQTIPERPASPGFDISALRASHTSYVNNLNDNHTREVANLTEAHARESRSLRTHIALLERQLALPRGQHLSPSGHLPLLNTSPPPISRTVSEGSLPDAPVQHVIPPSLPLPQPSPEEAAEEQRGISDAALAEAENLRATLKERDGEIRNLKVEKATLFQTVDAKDRQVKQMMAAMNRGAEKENELKTEMAELRTASVDLNKAMVDLQAKVEMTTDQNLDYQESLHAATSKIHSLVHGENTLKKELESLRTSPSTMTTEPSEVESIRSRLREAEEEHSDIQIKLSIERDSVSSLETALATSEASLDKARAELAAVQQDLITIRQDFSTTQTDLATARETIAELEKQNVSSPFDQMGMITIGNALIGRDPDASPLSATSNAIGRFDLVRREVRNLHVDERAQLMAFMRCLDGEGYTSSSAQTEKAGSTTTASTGVGAGILSPDAVSATSSTPASAKEGRDRDREKTLRAAVRKLESERDQLSNLLSIEIRRAARMTAKQEELGFSRLERYDSIRSRVGSLSAKSSPSSPEARAVHSGCESRFEKARDMYEEEIRGLVKEIVLYKLDVKGYKKDLRRASSTISKLKVGFETPLGSPEMGGEKKNVELEEVEKPAPLRTRRSTTHLLKEQMAERERERERKGGQGEESTRSASVDALGIALTGTPVKTATRPVRPQLQVRAMTLDAASPALKTSESRSRLDRKDSGLGGGRGRGRTEEVVVEVAVVPERQRSVLTSYGKDRNSLPSELEVEDDELRPLSTVAEVGSAIGISPGS